MLMQPDAGNLDTLFGTIKFKRGNALLTPISFGELFSRI